MHNETMIDTELTFLLSIIGVVFQISFTVRVVLRIRII